MVVGWVLAITLVLVPHPLYAHYAALAQRPGGITALTDQQIAGGIMWVPGSIAYTVALLIGFYRWLEADSKPASRPGLGGSPERDTEPALGGPPERDTEPALGGPPERDTEPALTT
jgi:hypothetical protein